MPIIDIVANQEPITVNLVGKTYLAHPPKTTLAMRLAEGMGDNPDSEYVMGRIEEYLTMTFGSKEAAKIRKRMDDPDDALDLGHIMELMTKITEVQTGNPTS